MSSLDSISATTNAPVGASSDVKAERWKQGARKTLLNWVTNALPKYVPLNRPLERVINIFNVDFYFGLTENRAFKSVILVLVGEMVLPFWP